MCELCESICLLGSAAFSSVGLFLLLVRRRLRLRYALGGKGSSKTRTIYAHR